jgi:hypothetical protein
MAEDIGPVLNQIAALLTRMSDQNDARLEHFKELEIRNRGRGEEMQKRLESMRSNRPDFTQQRADMKKNMEEARVLGEKRRQEDLEFKQRLLNEIERHNRLLETLIERLGEK